MKAATCFSVKTQYQFNISIHAAREGGDFVTSTNSSELSAFQSTPPVKAATNPRQCNFRYAVISIHAAREGGDRMFQHRFPACKNISIHAAREGGDHNRSLPSSPTPISIHAAREGGDALKFTGFNSIFYFNPRRP